MLQSRPSNIPWPMDDDGAAPCGCARYLTWAWAAGRPASAGRAPAGGRDLTQRTSSKRPCKSYHPLSPSMNLAGRPPETHMYAVQCKGMRGHASARALADHCQHGSRHYGANHQETNHCSCLLGACCMHKKCSQITRHCMRALRNTDRLQHPSRKVQGRRDTSSFRAALMEPVGSMNTQTEHSQRVDRSNLLCSAELQSWIGIRLVFAERASTGAGGTASRL